MSGAVYATYGSLAPSENRTNATEQPNLPPCMEIQNLEHRRSVLKNNAVVCIGLHGDWCEPCKLIDPQYRMLAQQFGGSGAALVKENIDLELTRDVNVGAVPAFIFYKNSHLVRENNKPLVVMGGDFKKINDTLNSLLTDNKPPPVSHPQSTMRPLSNRPRN